MPSKDDLGIGGQRKSLHELCIKYVETYQMTGSEVEPLVLQVHELESAMGANGFLCRIERCVPDAKLCNMAWCGKGMSLGRRETCCVFSHCRVSCGLVFSTKATRNSHESKGHPNVTVEAQDLD